MKGKLATPSSEAALHKSASDLELANYQLALEEIAYDEKCLEVFKSKLSDYEIRVAQLKEQWVRKRLDGAKEAVHKWMDQYAPRLTNMEYFY